MTRHNIKAKTVTSMDDNELKLTTQKIIEKNTIPKLNIEVNKIPFWKQLLGIIDEN